MDVTQVRFSGNQAGQPGEPAAASVQPQPGTSTNAPATPQTTAQPQYLTVAEAQEMARKAAAEVYRQEQSRRDKVEQRVNKFVTDQIAALKTAGITPTPDQEQQIAAAASNRFRSELEPSPAQAEPGSPPGQQAGGTEQPGTGEPLSAAEKIVLETVNEYGFDILDGDPELKSIKIDGTERQFVKSYEAALEAKRLRLAQSGGRNLTNPQANLPALGGPGFQGNPISTITDPATLLAMGLKGGR